MTEHSEHEVEITGPLGVLSGKLIVPDNCEVEHVVVIIPGSGPTDLDGNGPMINTNSYKMLAYALADRKIASLRIDKRGLFSSKAAICDANDVTIDDYAQDVAGWMNFVKDRYKNANIWLAGHSEGGLVALVTATKNTDLSGLILMACAGRRFGDLLRHQLKPHLADDTLRDEVMSGVSCLENGRTFDCSNLPDQFENLFAAQVQKYLIDVCSYDPIALASTFDGKLLIIHGAQDSQVPPEDAQMLDAANQSAKLVIVEGMNHVLKEVQGKDQNISSYTNPEYPISVQLISAISKFVTNT